MTRASTARRMTTGDLDYQTAARAPSQDRRQRDDGPQGRIAALTSAVLRSCEEIAATVEISVHGICRERLCEGYAPQEIHSAVRALEESDLLEPVGADLLFCIAQRLERQSNRLYPTYRRLAEKRAEMSKRRQLDLFELGL
jgi:hypothetical protein